MKEVVACPVFPNPLTAKRPSENPLRPRYLAFSIRFSHSFINADFPVPHPPTTVTTRQVAAAHASSSSFNSAPRPKNESEGKGGGRSTVQA